MTLDERVNDVVESMGNEVTMRHLWAIKIKKAIITAVKEDRKTRECCKVEREACAMIADEMKAELSQRPEKLQYGRTQIEVAEYIATEIRACKSKGD